MRPSLRCRPIQRRAPARRVAKPTACGQEIQDCVCFFERDYFVCIRQRSVDTCAACKLVQRGASCVLLASASTRPACIEDLNVWSLAPWGEICLCRVCVCAVEHSDLPTKPNRAQSHSFFFHFAPPPTTTNTTATLIPCSQ